MLQQITSPIRRGPLHQADVEFLQAVAPERLGGDIPVQSNSVAIDILMGSDYFWNIIDKDRITLPSRLLLLLLLLAAVTYNQVQPLRINYLAS